MATYKHVRVDRLTAGDLLVRVDDDGVSAVMGKVKWRSQPRSGRFGEPDYEVCWVEYQTDVVRVARYFTKRGAALLLVATVSAEGAVL
jgi:hypothetical protein